MSAPLRKRASAARDTPYARPAKKTGSKAAVVAGGYGATRGFRRWRSSWKARSAFGYTPKPQQLDILNQQPPRAITLKKAYVYYSGIVGASATTGSVLQFTAQNIPDFPNMATLFNRYRMSNVKLTFRIIDTGPADANNLTTLRLPNMLVRKNQDPNLSVAGATMAYLQQMDNVTQFQFTPEQQQFQFNVQPSVGRLIPIAGVSTGIVQGPPPFIDMTYNQVPHLAVAFALDFLATGLSLAIDVEWTLDLKYEM